MNAILNKLIECLEKYYTYSDLETLCLVFDIPSENIIIQSEPLSKTVLRLIGHFQREYGNVDSLVEAVIQTRPSLPCVADLEKLYHDKPTFAKKSFAKPLPTEMRVGVILVSDIERSTDKLEFKNEVEFNKLIESHNAIFRARITDHRGVEIRNQGDGFVIAFYTPRDSVLFALDVQFAFALRNAEYVLAHDQIRIRMGLHFGELILEDGKPEGKTAIIANRISSLAKGEEIVVSETIQSTLKQELNINFQNFGIHPLKGLPEKYQLYKIDWKNCLKDNIKYE